MPNTNLYSHRKRRQTTLEKRKKTNHETLQITQEICHSHWQTFLSEQIGDSDVITDIQLNELYEKIFQELSQKVKPSAMETALAQRLKFFNDINKQRRKANLEMLPIPSVPYRPKRPANTNDLDNFLYLEQAQIIVDNVFEIWQQKNRFTLLDTVTWLIFSLMTFSGYNEESVIHAIYQALKDKQMIYRLSNHQLFMSLDISSTQYANTIYRLNADSPDDVSLTYTRWVFFDDISRLWLSYFYQNYANDSAKFPTYTQCIQRLSEVTDERFDDKNFARSDFIRYINIYWQTLPNVRIDQQIRETLIGKQSHTAIPQAQLQRYFSPIRPSKIAPIKIINTITNPPTQTAEAVTAVTFKADIIKEIRKGLNTEKSRALTNLEQLYAQPLLPNQQRLIKWLIELYKKGNKINTLLRYLSEIGNDFLTQTRDTDFIGWQDYEYKFVYDKIVSEKNPLNMGYAQTVLASLHEVLVEYFNAPYLKMNREKDPLIVDSCLISVTLYQYILQKLAEESTLADELKMTLRLIVILVYRTGIRFGEVLGLRTADIEFDNQTFTDYNFFVRPYGEHELKSDDAQRRFSLNILLSPHELEEFKRHFNLKFEQNARYLFTLPNQANDIDRTSVELPIRTILGDKFRDISMHSFRHNAISNLAIILRCDYDVVQQFTDYSEEQAIAIRQYFLGTKRTISPNFWNVLQDFAGHADLNTTFSSYIHTADIIAHHQLAKAHLRLSLATVKKLSNLPHRSFNQHHPNAVDFSNHQVNLWHIRQLVNHAIPTQKLSHNSQFIKTRVEQKQTKEASNKQSRSAIFGQYNRQIVEKMLHDIESGMDVSTASQLNFDFQDALAIYQRALSLAKDETGKPNYKLISKKRQINASNTLLAPTALHYHQDQALVNLCFDNIEKLCQSSTGKKEIQAFIQIFYQKIDSYQSEIRFTFKQTKQFYQYVKTALKILPSQYWRINICHRPSKTLTDSKGKKTPVFDFDNKATQLAIDEFNKEFDDFDGQITQKQDYSGYYVSMILPNDKGKPRKSQPSSFLMKYVVHWLLIMGLG